MRGSVTRVVCIAAISNSPSFSTIDVLHPTDWDTVVYGGTPRILSLNRGAERGGASLFEASTGGGRDAASATANPAELHDARLVAEFEPVSHALVRYPLGIPASVVEHFSRHLTVALLCHPAQVREAQATLEAANVTMVRTSWAPVHCPYLHARVRAKGSSVHCCSLCGRSWTVH